MVLWNGLGQVATVAQLAGVDAYGLIKMIVEAAHTAKRNKESCQKIARRAKMIRDLLQHLQSTGLIQHPETRNPVEELEKTLRHTFTVIASCQDSSYLQSCFMAGKQADQLCEVQSDIDSCLQLFLLVGLVDNTRSWERLLSRAHPFCTKDITDELHTAHHSEHEIRKTIWQLAFQPPVPGSGFRAELTLPALRILLMSYTQYIIQSMRLDETKRTLLIWWFMRLKIIEEMADGLLYLHNHSIIHMDLKASNILLDHELNTKISDFGLAMKLAPNATTVVDYVVADRGCVAPEYLAKGIISDKLDVYSFGIVLLEIISGKRWFSWPTSGNLDSTLENLDSLGLRARFLKSVLENRERLHEIIDPLLAADKQEGAQIMQCLKVAMLCVRDPAEHWPSMSEVVTMLPSSKTPKHSYHCITHQITESE